MKEHAAYNLSETDYERVFDISGYVLSPKRAQLGVRNYEGIAMLSHNMQLVYIDEDWVVKEYIQHAKKRNGIRNRLGGTSRILKLISKYLRNLLKKNRRRIMYTKLMMMMLMPIVFLKLKVIQKAAVIVMYSVKID